MRADLIERLRHRADYEDEPDFTVIDSEIMREAANALEALQSGSAGEVAVKPLEWGADNEASSPVANYRIQRLDDKWEPLWNGNYMLPKRHGVVDAFGTVDEARAYVETHHERLVRSALATPAKAAGGWKEIETVQKNGLLRAVSSFLDRDGPTEMGQAVMDLHDLINAALVLPASPSPDGERQPEGGAE